MLLHLRRHINNRLSELLKNDAINMIPYFSLPSINNGVVTINLPISHLSPLFSEKEISNIKTLNSDYYIQNVHLSKGNNLEDLLCFSIKNNRFSYDVLSGVDSVILPTSKKKKKIIVEFSSPNIAKPFHMGHFRSTIVGNFIANILEESNDVVKMNYLGDWGTQFGLVKAGLDQLSIDVSNLKNDPLKLINKAYILANKDESLAKSAKQISLSLENGENQEALNVWETIRKLTVKHLDDTYKALGVKFDEYTWESEFTSKKFMPIGNDMMKKELIEIIDNQMVLIKDDKRIPLLKSDGTSLYLSRDIASALDRFNRHKCDSIKYVIDKSQESHVSNLKFAVQKLLGHDLVEHIQFGRITGMSTRLGTSVFLNDILEEATKLMSDQQQKSPNTRDTSPEVTEVLAVSTLIVYLLRQRRLRDFKFDWNLALQSMGDSGVKLQYTHSRLCSLMNSCGVTEADTCQPHLISDEDTLNLILQISRYSDIMVECEADLESSRLINFLFKLTSDINKCLKKIKVKGQPSEIAEQRLLLFNCARKVLKKGMTILGLKSLEKM